MGACSETHVVTYPCSAKRFRPAAQIVMAVVDDAARRLFLHTEVDSDLVYVWDEAGVSLEHQYLLGQDYRTVRKFSAIGDTRAEARQAFIADIPLDPAAGAAQRAALAGLVTAWQVSSELNDKDIQNRAEAKNLGVPRPLTFTDRNALYYAYERVHGALEDKNSPSADYLSQKMEEVEQGELLASNLDEVGSKEESLTIAIQSSVDASGRLRVARERKKSKLPTNSEELRSKLKLECTTLIMLGSKFRNREWFRELNPNDFSKYVGLAFGREGLWLADPPDWWGGDSTTEPSMDCFASLRTTSAQRGLQAGLEGQQTYQRYTGRGNAELRDQGGAFHKPSGTHHGNKAVRGRCIEPAEHPGSRKRATGEMAKEGGQRKGKRQREDGQI